MDIKNVKFSVILPVLERQDIKLGFPKAIESIFKNNITPDFFILTIDGKIPKNNWDIINNLLFEIITFYD